MALYLGLVTHLKILKEPERQEINAHLATVNPGNRQPVQGRFLSFGDDNQAVRGLVDLLGMDDDYANEVLRNGEEMMKREVEALRGRLEIHLIGFTTHDKKGMARGTGTTGSEMIPKLPNILTMSSTKHRLRKSIQTVLVTKVETA